MTRGKTLYWVTTDDHAEDWFVVAESVAAACKFHEDEEGYERGDADAEPVCPLPPGAKAKIGWPSDELLRACGVEIVARDGAIRIARVGERVFGEGDMVAGAAARASRGTAH